ncbi:MAG TPA: trypsin-like peptidase domain-containing protein [Nocardioidaceae bacterium]|nr:trypsin-like peptidase domain-containing protein [Nocardioidaceae bacterium]
MSEHDDPDRPPYPPAHRPPPPSAYPPVGYGYPPPWSARQQNRVPGWLWPVVAATALLVGAVGGVLAGVAVSTTMSSGSAPIVLGTGHSVAAPLDPNNRSVAVVAQKLLPSTVQVLARGGADGNQRGGATGSGFVIDRDGHVITNNHVVANALGAGQVRVVDYAGHSHAARIVGRSPVYDIAVLEVDGGNHLRPASLGSSRSMHVGETVVAIGSPLGLSSTVTSGIVSALDRPVTTSEGSHSSYINAVQTDAAINPGNSGGPLVNLRGEVIGVNSAIATTGPTFGGQAGNIGVGFAIPMEQVELTAAEILRTGHAKYPVIGATVQVNGSGNGAKVVDVPPGSPADQAGLRKGDVVVAVDGTSVDDGIGLIVAIRAHQPGDVVTLTVRRADGQHQVRIRLAAKVG